MKIWNVAIYARVSTDKRNQQESIPAQIESLKRWLVEAEGKDAHSEYKLVNVYADEAVSGSTFDRDRFKEMERDIESGKVNMVLTRDLSRFSRNYIAAGYYLEDYFSIKQVRFVSVLDNVDTEEEMNDIIPFKNILNEMYIKDCSKRIRDALKERMLRGSSIASKPPYGYRFDVVYHGNLKTIKLVPAEDEGPDIIREIFKLFLSGWGYGRIATYLNRKKIPPPAHKLIKQGRGKLGLWCNGTIKSILTNPKYGGMLIQQRWRKVSYKVKTIKATTEDQWVNSGEFEGIISSEIFREAQELVLKRSRSYRYKGEARHPYTPVLRCNECGGSMSYRNKYEGYKCTNSQRGGGRCSSHSIKEEFLNKVIISDLKKYVSEYLNSYEICEALVEKRMKSNKKYNKLDKVIRDLEKLDGRLEKVYEDRFDGVINEETFKTMILSLEQKQLALMGRKTQLEDTSEVLEGEEHYFQFYKEQLDKLINFEIFQANIIQKLVDKIIVTEDKEQKAKKVDIYYRFK